MDGEGSLNELLQDVNDVQNSKHYQDITKTHHQRKSYSGKCSAPDCGKAFNPISERPHNCRRCGHLFCSRCLRYQRRLNKLAKPDPNGRLHKVCKKCYDQGPESIGSSRSWSRIFHSLRAIDKESPSSLSSDTTDGSVKNHRERLDLEKECQRLTEGFHQSVGDSEIKRHVVDVFSMVTVPEWQKSYHVAYGNMAAKCSECGRDFGLRRQKHLCTVCGSAVCTSKKCSSKDLLVYVPDKSEVGSQQSNEESGNEDCLSLDSRVEDSMMGTSSREPQLAIIKIVGCPGKEPSVSLYLRICNPCQQRLSDLQFQRFHRDRRMSLSEPRTESWSVVIRQCDRLRLLEANIETLLPQFQELVDYIDGGGTPPPNAVLPSSGDGKIKRSSCTQILAKQQSDLSDHLTQFPMMILALKQVQPETEGQAFIFKNIITGKCQFYHEQIFLFRECKRKLAESTPPDVLGAIQGIVDQNAINSGYLSIKQLAFEVLHLSAKYELGDEVPRRLVQTESVMYDELKREICKNPDENWQVHEKCLDRLIQSQLKDKERHLIKPSRRLLRKLGARHVQEVTRERCIYVVQQVQLQLEEKSASKEFKGSKEELGSLLEYFGARPLVQ